MMTMVTSNHTEIKDLPGVTVAPEVESLRQHVLELPEVRRTKWMITLHSVETAYMDALRNQNADRLRWVIEMAAEVDTWIVAILADIDYTHPCNTAVVPCGDDCVC
jgi:hypothetical protein